MPPDQPRGMGAGSRAAGAPRVVLVSARRHFSPLTRTTMAVSSEEPEATTPKDPQGRRSTVDERERSGAGPHAMLNRWNDASERFILFYSLLILDSDSAKHGLPKAAPRPQLRSGAAMLNSRPTETHFPSHGEVRWRSRC